MSTRKEGELLELSVEQATEKHSRIVLAKATDSGITYNSFALL